MNGVNALGESGYRGKVSNHPWETLKALGMIAVYSMIETEVTADINSQDNEFLQNAMTDVWTEASKMGNKILDRALDIQPTIKIKSGTEIKIITNTSLELPPCKVDQATKKYVRTK
jgi:type IV secretion system protein VirB10